jgi:nucleotide-binding universal stress UspA family protein
LTPIKAAAEAWIQIGSQGEPPMSFKSVLIHVVDDRGCSSRLRMTASVARVLGAEVIGLGAQAPWPYSTGDVRGGDAYAKILEDTQRSMDAAGQLFRERLKDPAIASSWRTEVGYPEDVIPRQARVADLIVAYPTRGDVDRSVYAPPDTLLMEAGLPVLLLPEREADFRAERVLFGWKNTREARRAISVTLPLLKMSQRVLVAAICSERETEAVERELADVVQRLTRHGVSVTTLVEIGASGPAGANLLRMAQTDRSDLIVTGGYGHSRLREWVLGGVTRDLIADGERYVLLSR